MLFSAYSFYSLEDVVAVIVSTICLFKPLAQRRNADSDMYAGGIRLSTT